MGTQGNWIAGMREKVASRMEELGIDGREFALRARRDHGLPIHEADISRVRNGRRPPSNNMITALALVLEVDPGQLGVPREPKTELAFQRYELAQELERLRRRLPARAAAVA